MKIFILFFFPSTTSPYARGLQNTACGDFFTSRIYSRISVPGNMLVASAPTI